MKLETRTCRSVSELDQAARAVLDAGDICSGAHWFGAFESMILQGAPAWYLTVSMDGEPVLVLPLMQTTSGRLKLRTLAGLGNYYTTLYPLPYRRDRLSGPALAEVMRAAVAHLREHMRWAEMIEFRALDAADPGVAALCAALAEAGYAASQFNCFGNWSEPITCTGFDEYMQARPGELRSTFKRKGKRLQKERQARYEVLSAADELDRGFAAFEAVYGGSWKHAEPYPDFIRSVARDLAARGRTRLGTLYVDDAPAASQLWFLTGDCAGVYKLAYDNRFAEYSVGTLLMGHMIRRFIDEEGVRRLDFMMGDDRYKQDWATVRCERVGIEAINRATVRGRLLCLKRGWERLRRSGAAPVASAAGG
ncbi:MAG: GNAT family N-acetyltransferase [Gammaproteobacteria bacterium]